MVPLDDLATIQLAFWQLQSWYVTTYGDPRLRALQMLFLLPVESQHRIVLDSVHDKSGAEVVKGKLESLLEDQRTEYSQSSLWCLLGRHGSRR